MSLRKTITCAIAQIGIAVTAAAPVRAADAVNFDIPREPLAKSLQHLAEQSGLSIVHYAKFTEAKVAPPLKGSYTPESALRVLLKDSGLQYTFVNPHTVEIETAQNLTSEATSKNSYSPDAGISGQQADQDKLQIAQNTGTSPQPTQPRAAAATGREPTATQDSQGTAANLGEIIVTAQKRSEHLQDVPVPVTALSADTLLNRNELRLQDYFSSVPGLSYLPGVRGESLLVIRGVTTDPYTNPTVSITIDDVPYGASTVNGGGNSPPDIDPSDLARVEVLRGPQGTLYGASSIGGLLKYVTVDPSPDGFSGRVQGGGSWIHNGEGTGYSVRGAVNVPLSDTVAVRASAFTRRDPGYIDNIQTGQDGVNRVNASGGRVSGLWKPSDLFSAKLSAQLQDSKAHGSPDIDPRAGLGDLQQRRLIGTGEYERKSQIYSANLTGTLGGIQVTSLSGYTIDSLNALRDYTIPPFSTLASRFFGVGGASLLDDRRTTKFSEEVRLSASIGDKVDWLVGGFYTDERAPFVESLSAAEVTTGIPVGTILVINFPSTYKEYAGFADVTYHFTDRFDVQFGGRESHDKQQLDQTQTLLGKVTAVSGHSSENAFTYLVTPRFKISPDLMVYARFASGFRPGGINAIGGTPTVPLNYGPDKTQNYEIGAKGDLADHRVSFDASLYYIDWKNIQLSLSQNGLGFRDNAGRAKSQGVELSVDVRPLQGLSISSWAAWDDAKLSENFPATSTVHGADGDRLPNSARFSANMSIDQEFPVAANVTGFVGGSLSYVGDRLGTFTATAVQRQRFPGYAKTDLRTGLHYDAWTANLFLTNVADRRGIFTGNLLGAQPFIDYIQPRTIGVSVSRTF